MPPQPPHTHGPQSPDSTDPGADTPANASDIAHTAEAAATAELQRSAAARDRSHPSRRCRCPCSACSGSPGWRPTPACR